MTAPSARTLSVIDYHTEGEPMRIVVGGVDAVPGATLMARSEYLAAHGRDLLGFTLYEPRGHAAMCGAILTDPVAPEADAGVLFIEPLGPVHMCGHGAIALGAMLVESGRVAAPDGDATVTLETPAGLVACRVRAQAGRPTSVTIRNVPAFSVALDRTVEIAGLGAVRFDLAYGGQTRGDERGHLALAFGEELPAAGIVARLRVPAGAGHRAPLGAGRPGPRLPR